MLDSTGTGIIFLPSADKSSSAKDNQSNIFLSLSLSAKESTLVLQLFIILEMTFSFSNLGITGKKDQGQGGTAYKLELIWWNDAYVYQIMRQVMISTIKAPILIQDYAQEN